MSVKIHSGTKKKQSPHSYSNILPTNLLYGDIPGYMCIYVFFLRKKVMHICTKIKAINTIKELFL